MKKTAITVMAILIFAKILGFAKEMIVSYYFGASEVVDAFLVSQSIPISVYGLIVAGLGVGIIPIYTRITHSDSVKNANNFMNYLLKILIGMSTLIIILIFIDTRFFIRIFAPGFDETTTALAYSFTRIMSIILLFSSIQLILVSYLQIREKFVYLQILQALINIVFIPFVILAANFDVSLLGFGMLIWNVLYTILLFILAKYNGYVFSIKSKYSKYVKEIILLSIPVIIGVSASQMNLMVDRYIASNLGVGIISALNYSVKLTSVVDGIFIASIATIIYPSISRHLVVDNIDKVKIMLNDIILAFMFILIPSSIGLMIYSKEIIQLLFGRGAFDITAITLTSSALYYYALKLIPYGVIVMYTRVFLAMEDSRTPMIDNLYGVIVNIVLNILLSRFMGIGGIALSTTISMYFVMMLLSIHLRRKLGPMGIYNMRTSLLKISVATLIMSLLSIFTHKYLLLIWIPNISILITIILTIIYYIILLYIFKVREFQQMIIELRTYIMSFDKNKATPVVED